MRKVLVLGAALCALTMAARVDAASITVATFADPSTTSSTPLFTYLAGTGTTANPTGSTLSGGWSGTGLDLLFSPTAQTFSDVTFDFASLTSTGGFATAGGSMLFFGTGSFSFIYNGSALLTYSWSSATLTDTSVSSSDLLLQGLTITAAGALAGWTFSPPETYAFSLVNPTNTIFGALSGANGGSATWTASFTSSAGSAQYQPPVPEPGSLLLLGGGLVALAATVRRRRAASRR